MDQADARHDARGGAVPVVQAVRGQRADLEEGRALVEQRVDAVPHQQLAAAGVALARALGPAERRAGDEVGELLLEPSVAGRVALGHGGRGLRGRGRGAGGHETPFSE